MGQIQIFYFLKKNSKFDHKLRSQIAIGHKIVKLPNAISDCDHPKSINELWVWSIFFSKIRSL